MWTKNGLFRYLIKVSPELTNTHCEQGNNGDEKPAAKDTAHQKTKEGRKDKKQKSNVKPEY